jgi:hypothetical protein
MLFLWGEEWNEKGENVKRKERSCCELFVSCGNVDEEREV